MPFQKGQSGNPNGRPKGVAVIERLNVAINVVPGALTIQESEVRERFRILNELYGWFTVVHSQEGYPDLILSNREGTIIRTEVETWSRNFILHKHDIADCDLILCWRHNWLECPIPVFTLSVEWLNYEQLKQVRPYLLRADAQPPIQTPNPLASHSVWQGQLFEDLAG